MDSERAHHPKGPSRWPMLVECGQFESDGPSDAAERGTAIHRQAERGEIEWCEDTILKHCGFDPIERERRLQNGDFFGTADVYSDSVIIDWKTGYGDTDYRPQGLGLLYASGLPKVKFVVANVDKKQETEYDLERSEAEDLYKLICMDRPANACKFCSWCKKRETCEAFKARYSHGLSIIGQSLPTDAEGLRRLKDAVDAVKSQVSQAEEWIKSQDVAPAGYYWATQSRKVPDEVLSYKTTEYKTLKKEKQK